MAAPNMTPEDLITLFAAKAAAPPPETRQALARHLQCRPISPGLRSDAVRDGALRRKAFVAPPILGSIRVKSPRHECATSVCPHWDMETAAPRPVTPSHLLSDSTVFEWQNQTLRADLVLILPVALSLGIAIAVG